MQEFFFVCIIDEQYVIICMQNQYSINFYQTVVGKLLVQILIKAWFTLTVTVPLDI